MTHAHCWFDMACTLVDSDSDDNLLVLFLPGMLPIRASDDVQHAGPIELRNPGLLMDVMLHQNGKFQHTFPDDWSAFAYIYHGNGTLGGSPSELQSAMVLDKGNFVEAHSEDQQVHTASRCAKFSRPSLP